MAEDGNLNILWVEGIGEGGGLISMWEEGKSPIAEMHKNITVEAEDPEQEVNKHERETITPEATHRSQICVI
jgi:hypothetical protein